MASIPAFPALLKKAHLSRYQVLWRPEDLDGVDSGDIEAYKEWKQHWGIDTLTPAKLRALHSRQLYSKDIFQLFRKNKKIDYLEQELQRHRSWEGRQ